MNNNIYVFIGTLIVIISILISFFSFKFKQIEKDNIMLKKDNIMLKNDIKILKTIEKFGDGNTGPGPPSEASSEPDKKFWKEMIIEEINKIYDIDVESIRNLGMISKSLLTGKNYHKHNSDDVDVDASGTLVIPANVIIEGTLSVEKTLSVGSTLRVGGTVPVISTLEGEVIIEGNLTVNKEVKIKDSLTVETDILIGNCCYIGPHGPGFVIGHPENMKIIDTDGNKIENFDRNPDFNCYTLYSTIGGTTYVKYNNKFKIAKYNPGADTEEIGLFFTEPTDEEVYGMMRDRVTFYAPIDAKQIAADNIVVDNIVVTTLDVTNSIDAKQIDAEKIDVTTLTAEGIYPFKLLT